MKSRYTKIFMVIIAVFTMLLALFVTPNRALAEEVDTVAYDYSVIENSIPDEAIVSFPVVTESVYGNAITWSVQENQSVIEYDSEAGWMIVHRENAANENPDPEDPTFKGSIVTLNVTIAGEAKVLQVKVPYGTTNVPSYSIAYKELVGEELVDATPEGAKTQFKLGEKTFTLPEPEERTGYTFEGWYVGEQKVTKVLCGTMNDVEVVAKWVAKEYTLTINVDGQITTKTYAYGATIEEIAEPTKEGHEFTGWGREVPATMPAGDVELVAKWTANTYKVVFDVDGVKQEKTFTYGSTIEPIENPSKEGHTFSGWEPALPENMPAQDLEVSATWTTNKYTLTFLLDDGSEYLVVNQDYASELAIENPTKTGYSFDGWDLQVEGKYDGSADQLPGAMPAENRTYKAIFTANEGINVVFNTQGGNNVASMSGDFDAVIQLPLANEVTKEGHTFKEWNTSADGNGTSYAGGADFKINSETTITLYAIWTVNSYVLTLNLDGVEQSKTYEFGATVDAYPTPTKDGYVFMGWRTEPDGEVVYTPGQEPETMPAYDLTLYIYWQAQNYTVTFESNGGSEVAAITQAYESEVAKPDDPTKAGYTFGGWYTDQELENAATFPYEMPLNGATLYAKWDVVEYTITYADAKDFYTDSVKYTVEDTPVALPAPQQAGYEFAGWYDAQDKLVESIAQGTTGDVTLNAKWDLVTYNITYTGLENANAPEGNPATYTVESDAITLLNPTKSGYKFLGWYDGENQVEVIAEGSTGDLTLEAKWEKGDLLKKAEEDAEAIKELYQDALAGTTITEALEDAFVLVGPVHGLKVHWHTSNSAASVSNEDGLMTVVRSPEKDMIVTLTATIEYTDVDNPEQSYSAATSFTFTVAQYVTYTVEDETTNVSVSKLEEELTLSVSQYKNAEAVKTANANFALEANEEFLAGYDITLSNETSEVSSFPNGVQVRIPLGKSNYNSSDLVVYHINDEGIQETVSGIEVETDAEGNQYVVFTATAFSPYIVAEVLPEYTITFVLGQGLENVSSKQVYGAELNVPEVPTVDGYTFIGWSPELPTTVPGQDTTYTAQWEEVVTSYEELSGYYYKTVSGSFDKTGGDVTLNNVNWVSSALEYVGWSSTKGVQIGSGSYPASNWTLESKLQYTNISKIVVEAGTASDGVATLNVYVGSNLVDSVSLTTEVTSYEFTVSSDYKGKIKIEMCAEAKAMYLTSISVNPVEYTITYHANNGSDATKTYTGMEATIEGIGDWVNSGYTFNGWNTNEDGSGTSYSKDDVITLTGDLNLYAVWEEVVVGEKTYTYKKVTEAPSDWSGTYLIVYEDEQFIFNSSTTTDASNNYVTVAISDNKIVLTENANYFTISTMTGGYSIKGTSNMYIGLDSDANKLSYSASEKVNTIALNDDGTVNIISEGGAYLRFNTTSGQDRFRYYKSGTYTNQKAICLYKLVEE